MMKSSCTCFVGLFFSIFWNITLILAVKRPILILNAEIEISISYFLVPTLPCLEDDLRVVEAELSCLFFFLSRLLVSDETSAELLADLLPVAEILENSFVHGGFEAVENCSPSDSSAEVSDSEDCARLFGHCSGSSESATFSGVFSTTEVTYTFLLKNLFPWIWLVRLRQTLESKESITICPFLSFFLILSVL